MQIDESKATNGTKSQMKEKNGFSVNNIISFDDGEKAEFKACVSVQLCMQSKWKRCKSNKSIVKYER